jgi:hypothetical protein
MIGSVLPWATFGSSSFSGLDATRGKTTFVLGAGVVVVGVSMLFRCLRTLALVAVIASIVILVEALMTTGDFYVDGHFYSENVGSGVWVTSAAGLVSLVGGVAALTKRRRP